MKISKGDLLVTYKDSIIKLNRLKAQLNSGGFSLDGDINLSRGIPDINLKYKFDEAGISLFKKSDLVFSGKGSLVGNSVPYNLAGQFIINKCNIINEITDFGGDGKLVQEEIDFLPENTSKGLENYLNFNITVNTFDPIRITNSMADIGFMGNLQLTGGERDPHLEGKISLAPMINKVKFKNNEFVLSKGNIFFYERNEIFNPELDFMAASTINDYKLYVKLLGPVDKFKLNLTSEQSLPQADILSLIAFGYTEDLSTNLTDAQKESLTKAGVGSIIFDSFKINETLKNEFGIQVNLGTEISQDESSYLSRAKGETSTVGKSRSATKVEVTKQLSSAIDLSVSSTVGGSVGQKQSMNLNYNINKSLSFEGVYESNSDTDSEEALNESSVGADLKIRWSFK